MTKLEKLLNLHQEISIIYIVDGYEAILYTNNMRYKLTKAQGATIYEALANLEIKVLDL